MDKQLNGLPVEAAEALREAFARFAADPLTRTVDVRKIKGTENQYRIRCGDYRLIFELNKKEKRLDALKASDRKDTY